MKTTFGKLDIGDRFVFDKGERTGQGMFGGVGKKISPSEYTMGEITATPEMFARVVKMGSLPEGIEIPLHAVLRIRKALKDDAAGNAKCTMTDLDSACDLIDELIKIKY